MSRRTPLFTCIVVVFATALAIFYPNLLFAQCGSPRLECSFGSGGVVLAGAPFDSYSVTDVEAYQSGPHQGKIVVSLTVTTAIESDIAVVRLNADGSPDISFANVGIAGPISIGKYDTPRKVLIQADDKIVVVGTTSKDDAVSGSSSGIGILRLTVDGVLDNTFSGDGKVRDFFYIGNASSNQSNFNDALLQPDGKIVACGTVGGRSGNHSEITAGVVRFNTNGSRDAVRRIDFSPTGGGYSGKSEVFQGIALQDSHIVVAGAFDGGVDIITARLNSDMTVDNTFGTSGTEKFKPNGTQYYSVYDVRITSTDKILIAYEDDSIMDYLVMRRNKDGGIDNTYDTDGIGTLDDGGSSEYISGMELQSDDNALVFGEPSSGDFGAMRLTTAGAMDNTFGTNGKTCVSIPAGIYGYPEAGTLCPDGKLLLAGGSNVIILVKMETGTGTPGCSPAFPPVAVCNNITINLLENSSVSITSEDVGSGSVAAITPSSLSANPLSFACSDSGPNDVTVTITDDDGNSASCTAVVYGTDPNGICCDAPTASCENITVSLDGSGNASITAADVGGGTEIQCGLGSESVSPDAFTCSPLGANTVTYTVTDVNGASSMCTATVTVEDNIPPVAGCQNVTVYLDAGGAGSITATQVETGSTDNCVTINLAGVSPNSFACSDVGPNTVTLTINDGNGNEDDCNPVITVSDTISPMAICQDVTIQLDASGNASIGTDTINNGSSDACGITFYSLSQTAFDCYHVGPNTVTLTVTDDNNNVSTCTSTVTIRDTVSPDAQCNDATVYLDENGEGGITVSQINNNSSDACGVDTMYLDQDSFYCSHLGNNTVTLTVVDSNANSSICNPTISVYDTIQPVALCRDVTLLLDEELGASTLADSVNNGSSDNCPVNLILSRNIFDCSDFGVVDVTLSVVDAATNSDSCTATVTIENDPSLVQCCLDGETENYYIQEVKEFMSMTTNTSGDDNGYGDYTNYIFSLPSPYIAYFYFMFTPQNQGNGAFAHNWEIYIDWNNNEEFEPTEKMVDYCTYGAFVQMISVAGRPYGLFRMRVIMQADTDNDGCQAGELPGDLCGPLGEGEVEDYFVLNGGPQIQTQNQIQTQSQLDVFPNPFSDEFIVTVDRAVEFEVDAEVEIVSSQGQIIYHNSRTITGNSIRVEADDIPPGTYLLRVKTGEEIIVKTVVKI